MICASLVLLARKQAAKKAKPRATSRVSRKSTAATKLTAKQLEAQKKFLADIRKGQLERARRIRNAVQQIIGNSKRAARRTTLPTNDLYKQRQRKAEAELRAMAKDRRRLVKEQNSKKARVSAELARNKKRPAGKVKKSTSMRTLPLRKAQRSVRGSPKKSGGTANIEVTRAVKAFEKNIAELRRERERQVRSLIREVTQGPVAKSEKATAVEPATAPQSTSAVGSATAAVKRAARRATGTKKPDDFAGADILREIEEARERRRADVARLIAAATAAAAAPLRTASAVGVDVSSEEKSDVVAVQADSANDFVPSSTHVSHTPPPPHAGRSVLTPRRTKPVARVDRSDTEKSVTIPAKTVTPMPSAPTSSAPVSKEVDDARKLMVAKLAAQRRVKVADGANFQFNAVSRVGVALGGGVVTNSTNTAAASSGLLRL